MLTIMRSTEFSNCSCFLLQIVPTLIHMMNISINSSGLSETTTGSSSFLSSSVDFSKARCAGMSCLITFVGYMPNHMQEFATNPIFEFLAQRRGGVQLYTIEACDSISDACEGFKTLGIPIFEVLSFVMPKLSSCERKEMAISILTMAAEIVSVFGCKIREDILRILVSTINQILAVPPIGLLKTQHSTFIDQQVQTPLFYLISNIIDTISPKSLDLISSFFPSIIPYLNSSSPLMRGYAILTAAHICKCCNYSSSTVPSLKNSLNMNLFISLGNSSEDEGHSENGINAFHLISEAAFDLVSRCQNVDARRLAAKAFVYLIQADKSQFLDKFDVLVPFSTEMIEYCGYTGLWCAIAMQYDMLLDNTAAVEAVINELPNGTDEVSFDAEFAVFLKNINTTKSFNNNFNSGIDESVEIEMNQDFNASLEEKLPEVAVSLFSASERIYNETRHEVKIMLATIISGIDQESLEIYAGSNEGKIVKIQRRVQMLRMQSCM
ncbi:hypothetical protein TRFO_07671 [Tritrichomonas foetus]|uniref:Uncharacterized protein n=1 Tax=Tritrichomonas foetus TaxID=1144522 RepID=A0A1J4JPC6_9EUKA|nr:hypothetical protein TRFO_07671 [Tritrichomonas foetus]|eukprot:OHT01007.1 hypothetical protein TRFO_07671 [Tritrichomonas foetus]